MTDNTRAELRRGIERLVREADSCIEVRVENNEPAPHHRRRATVSVYQVGTGMPQPTPPLTTAQQLALSVLVGEPDKAVLSALCDLLIEQGHEYAAAVAEKARAEERERCATLIETARYIISPGVIGQEQIVSLAQKIAAGLRSQ